MLSPEDQRRLTAIERELASNDPDLARRLRRGAAVDRLRNRAVPIALIVLGIVGILSGLLTSSLAVTLIAGLFPLWAGLRLRRLRRDGVRHLDDEHGPDRRTDRP